MDKWIRTAWNAFWVGLGASAVLIGQAVLAPGPAAPPVVPSPAAEPAPYVAPAPPPAAVNARPNAPVLSRARLCTPSAAVRCS